MVLRVLEELKSDLDKELGEPKSTSVTNKADLAEAYQTSIGLELTSDVLRFEFVAAYHGPKP